MSSFEVPEITPEIGFYCQQRQDRGVRSGIGVNGTTVLHHFQSGNETLNPALLWYVDLRFEGPGLPTDPSQARDWLLRHEDKIGGALRDAAKDLEVGIDAGDYWPYQRRIALEEPKMTGEISISAANRMSDGELAAEIERVADNWQSLLNQLTPLVGV